MSNCCFVESFGSPRQQKHFEHSFSYHTRTAKCSDLAVAVNLEVDYDMFEDTKGEREGGGGGGERERERKREKEREREREVASHKPSAAAAEVSASIFNRHSL